MSGGVQHRTDQNEKKKKKRRENLSEREEIEDRENIINAAAPGRPSERVTRERIDCESEPCASWPGGRVERPAFVLGPRVQSDVRAIGGPSEYRANNASLSEALLPPRINYEARPLRKSFSLCLFVYHHRPPLLCAYLR